ncbi:shikimate dehydrogenase family protein [Ectopseudomonas chengduensis]|nr:shikimate dehydrogenase [Pseudomonas sp. WS 5019]NMY17318.1 shikimate dehydrogenase [Pseudomonas sp. WS 5019]
MVNGSTELVAIVGSPIAQVKSPENFNRWFEGNALNRVMLPIDISAEALVTFLNTLRGWQNLRGCVVTIPYKQQVVEHLDALSERASALRSVNVIRREADGRLIGDNVDGEGFLNAGRQQGFDAKGKRALVIGAGGVGSAIAYSLCQAGASALALSDVSHERVEALAQLLRSAFPELPVSTRIDSLSTFDLIANASPVGMGDSGELPLPEALLQTLPASAHVADVVTTPEITPLLALAKARGCSIQTGPQMALAQAGNLGHFMGATALVL